MNKYVRGVWLIMVSFFFVGIGNAYTLTDADHRFLQPVKTHIEQVAVEDGKEELIRLASKLHEISSSYEVNSRPARVLSYLRAYVMRQFDLAVSGKWTIDAYRTDIQLADLDTSEEEDDIPYSPGIPVSTISPEVTEHERAFYEQYRPLVLSDDTQILENCIIYYDQIDQIAREYDFPTPLIISTRYREHTCYFNNPNNGRGNFQITSHFYQPGEISWSDFEVQIVNFINFSRAKRAWYDNLLLRDDISIDMTHDQYDLQSIRKHAILYNGIKAWTTPETNKYANQNFGEWEPEGKDGIVAMFLKVVKWEIENRE